MNETTQKRVWNLPEKGAIRRLSDPSLLLQGAFLSLEFRRSISWVTLFSRKYTLVFQLLTMPGCRNTRGSAISWSWATVGAHPLRRPLPRAGNEVLVFTQGQSPEVTVRPPNRSRLLKNSVK